MQDIWNAFEIKKSPNENNHIYIWYQLSNLGPDVSHEANTLIILYYFTFILKLFVLLLCIILKW